MWDIVQGSFDILENIRLLEVDNLLLHELEFINVIFNNCKEVYVGDIEEIEIVITKN